MTHTNPVQQAAEQRRRGTIVAALLAFVLVGLWTTWGIAVGLVLFVLFMKAGFAMNARQRRGRPYSISNGPNGVTETIHYLPEPPPGYEYDPAEVIGRKPRHRKD